MYDWALPNEGSILEALRSAVGALRVSQGVVIMLFSVQQAQDMDWRSAAALLQLACYRRRGCWKADDEGGCALLSTVVSQCATFYLHPFILAGRTCHLLHLH